MTEVVVPAMTAVFLGSFASDGSADSDVGTGRMTWAKTNLSGRGDDKDARELLPL